MPTEPRVPLGAVATPGARAPGHDVMPGLPHAAWLARVEAWRRVFAAQPAGDLGLYFDDAGEFAAALFGAWQDGRTPWLAPDALPATRAQLGRHVVAFAGDGADSPRAPDIHDGDPPA